MIVDALIAPFTEFEFMRRALAAVIALSLGAAPIGVFLMLRRMSLVGDAMAHAILPGAAIGFLVSGLNLFAMTTGGLIAGFAVAILAGLVARNTELKEDASLATFYLVSLALGVTIVSVKGTNIDLLHVLFGNILAMDNQTLLVIAFNATITLLVLAVIYRPLVIECVDPRVPAHRQPRRRAGASRLPGACRRQSRQRLSCARHLARRRADDPARRHRPLLVARHHRHDLHRGRERDRVGLCGPRAVVPDRHSLGPRDHSGRGGALHGLAPVRQLSAAWCGRPSPAAISKPDHAVPFSAAVLLCMGLFSLFWFRRGDGPVRLRCADRKRVRPRAPSRSRWSRAFPSSAISSAMSAATASSVTTLVGPDSDAHVYAPTPRDAKKIADASLIVVNGFGFEGWLPRLVQSSGSKAKVVTATDGITPLRLGHRTPIRMPGNRSTMRRSMSPISAWRSRPPIPPAASNYRANADAYLAKLDALDREIRRRSRADSAGAPQGDFHPQRLRLFRRRLRHRIHRAARRFHGIRAQRAGHRQDHHPDQTGRKFRRFFLKMSAIPA